MSSTATDQSLYKIGLLYEDAESNNTSSYPILRQEWNSDLQKRRETEKKSKQDPLEVFPVEIWAVILALSAVTDGKYTRFQLLQPNDPERLFVMTLVSSRWRDYILSEQSLWSQITIDDRMPGWTAMLATALSRSGSRAIELLFPSGINDIVRYPVALSLLENNQKRIVGLYIADWFAGQGDVAPIHNLLAALAPMMNLEELEISPTYNTRAVKAAVELLTPSKRLRKIIGICFDSNALDSGLLSRWKLARMEVSGDGTSSSATKVLRTAELATIDQIEEHPLRHYTIEKHNWTHDSKYRVDYRYTAPSNEAYFTLIASCSTLTAVTVTVALKSLERLFEALMICPTLKQLSLTLEIPAALDQSSVREITSTGRLESFTLQAVYQKGDYSHESHGPIYHSIRVFTQDASQITVRSNGTWGAMALITARRYPSHSKIFAHDPGILASSRLDRSHVLNTTQSLTLITSMRMFGKLGSPTEELNVGIDHQILEGRSFHTVKATRWTDLKKLTVGIPQLFFIDGSSKPFKDLTNLSIYSDKSIHCAYITEICYQLASHKWVCPALRELTFGQWPEYDILFIMLERRMVKIDKTSSRIDAITLPGAPAPHLIKPLCEALDGFLPDRPTLRELSVISGQTIALDTKLPGCVACHRMQVYCSLEPIHTHRSSFTQADVPYPNDVSEILDTWKERSKAWHEQLDGVRFHDCGVWARTKTMIRFTGGSYERVLISSMHRVIAGNWDNTSQRSATASSGNELPCKTGVHD